MDSKRSHSPTSAEIIAGNEELLVETILIWLHAKPLMRFKAVSKQWQYLISHPSFSRRHTLHLRPKSQPSYILHPKSQLTHCLLTNPDRFFYFSPMCKAFHSFKFNFHAYYIRILQSCNGLLLLESRISLHGKKSYFVCNHSLNQSIAVEIERHAHVSGVCLAFDPSTSLHFKIVCVYNPDYSVEVYDSESKEWTNFGTPFPSDVNTKFMNGIYWNNKMYWFRPTSKSYYFDLQTGNVGSAPSIKTPCRRCGEVNKNYIMESNGRVHCVSIYLRPKRRSVYVFELMDDNSGWIELYKININSTSDEYPEIWRQMMDGQIELLGFVRGDTKDESSVLLHVPGFVSQFKFSDGSFELVLDVRAMDIYRKNELQFTRFDTIQFIESLAMPPQ